MEGLFLNASILKQVSATVRVTHGEAEVGESERRVYLGKFYKIDKG